jgi:hypothetical protein
MKTTTKTIKDSRIDRNNSFKGYTELANDIAKKNGIDAEFTERTLAWEYYEGISYATRDRHQVEVRIDYLQQTATFKIWEY